MKDEIKEILARLSRYVITPDVRHDFDDLLDYITNLQEENERLKLAKDTKCASQILCECLNNVYKSRNEKAINYIMTELITEWDIKNCGYVSGSDLPADAITPLLNILQGEDKE